MNTLMLFMSSLGDADFPLPVIISLLEHQLWVAYIMKTNTIVMRHS